MPQLLAHLIGDYVLQNHWMGQNKTKAWLPAIVHVAFYSLPFLLLADNWRQMAVISGTHLLIDRFRLARYWNEWWGIGNPGILWTAWDVDAFPWEYNWGLVRERVDEGRAPDWLAVWLLIIVDNTMHLTINWASLTYL